MNLIAITANIVGWPILQLSIARMSLHLPQRCFAIDRAPSARQLREADLYRRVLRIRKWKALLPDGTGWIGGTFPKRRLASRHPEYLLRFALEARRGEWAHWCMLCCAPIFYLWNPPWASVVMTIYALLANLPCILVQRYNRILILRGVRANHQAGVRDKD
ncbi:hypothetical protein [Granulicella mallensis]|uniref:Glycosyl-4,4'-diaponeurosporenoate acyltransferase n=1 Tax=Granulicella mallensis TaxID=940614 RepID=A0A7W7ZPD4_9BACT|nr:hypothetical protein [Granulicella mallensis]MBB5063282.1 glycosyl-4,4'-diaponeurosporenoate acyltransferase [Granulicella mallensis]